MDSPSMIWKNVLLLSLGLCSLTFGQSSKPSPAVEDAVTKESGKESAKDGKAKPVSSSEGQRKPMESAKLPKVETEPFSLDLVVSPRVAAMPAPQLWDGVEGIRMLVSSPSEQARSHVKQGFGLVHSQWDFEAYRHFCAAIKEDPDCLLAYCGLTLALAKPYNEYVSYQRAAVDRMLTLMEDDQEAGKYPDVEKQFAAAVATLVATSPRGAGVLFLKLSDQFPGVIQARLLALFLSRGGYDVLGDPTAGQENAIVKIRQLLKKNSENPMVISFWLNLNAEAPPHVVDPATELLPYARQLVKINPKMPAWQYVLGHYEWRSGHYDLAAEAFTQSADLYAVWMKQNKISINDCEGYLKAKCYLVNTLYQKGDFDAALKMAQELRENPLDSKRLESNGNAMLLWRISSLPARLYMAVDSTQTGTKNLDMALKSLASAKEVKAFVADSQTPSLAGVYIDALRIYLGARKAILKKDFTAASNLQAVTLRKHIMALAKVSQGARRFADYSHFLRAGNSLSIYEMELAGLIALHSSPKLRAVANARFLAARDKQLVPSMMMPPLVLNPMENRLGECYLAADDGQGALDAYAQGEKRYPNNKASLQGMRKAYLLLKQNDQADAIQQRLDSM